MVRIVTSILMCNKINTELKKMAKYVTQTFYLFYKTFLNELALKVEVLKKLCSYLLISVIVRYIFEYVTHQQFFLFLKNTDLMMILIQYKVIQKTNSQVRRNII